MTTPKFNLSNIIILDGPRGSGKSTTGQLVLKELEIMGKKARYYKKGLRDDKDEFGNMMAHLVIWSMESRYIICDRFLATEWVMSTFHQREDGVKLLSGCTIIDQILTAGKALNIVLMADNKLLESRMKSRGEDGRTWDMDPGAVQPLWRLTDTLFSSVEIMENNNEDDQALLAKSIALKAIINHEHGLELVR